jgi:hypothetical protein
MAEQSNSIGLLQSPLELPCGAILRNRLAKSPMSDSLANGEGDPTETYPLEPVGEAIIRGKHESVELFKLAI